MAEVQSPGGHRSVRELSAWVRTRSTETRVMLGLVVITVGLTAVDVLLHQLG